MVFLTRTVGHVFVTPRVMTSFALHHSSDTAMANGFTMQLASLPANAQTVTVPALTGDDTFVFAGHTQTLTNKTLDAPVLTGTANIQGATLDGGTGATIDGIFNGGTFNDGQLVDPILGGEVGFAPGSTATGTLNGGGMTTLTNMMMEAPTLLGNVTVDNATIIGYNTTLQGTYTSTATMSGGTLSGPTLTGTIDASGATVTGPIVNGLTLQNMLTAHGSGAAISGEFNATGATFTSPTISNGTLSGGLTSDSGSFSGSFDAEDATFVNPTIEGPTISGTISADSTALSGTFDSSAATLTNVTLTVPTIRQPISTWHERVLVSCNTNIADLNNVSTTLDMDSAYSFGDLQVNDRVLVADQTTTSQNGIYYKSSSTTLTRAADLPEGPCATGALVAVQFGTLRGGRVFMMTSPTFEVNVGTTGHTWSGVTGGTGITVDGNDTLENKTIDVADNFVTLFRRFTKSANETLGDTGTTGWTFYRCDVSDGPITLTLPTALGSNVIVTFSDTGSASTTDTITIDGDGTQTIGGAPTFVINAPHNSITLMSNGVDGWHLL